MNEIPQYPTLADLQGEVPTNTLVMAEQRMRDTLLHYRLGREEPVTPEALDEIINKFENHPVTALMGPALEADYMQYSETFRDIYNRLMNT